MIERERETGKNNRHMVKQRRGQISCEVREKWRKYDSDCPPARDELRERDKWKKVQHNVWVAEH